MTIDADLPLPTLLRTDPAVRERLLALLDPGSALGQLVAGDAVPARLRVGEAARMAGVPLDRFAAVLSGDTRPATDAPPRPPASHPKAPSSGGTANDWFAQAEEAGVAPFDVRPILAEGRDPFAEVMKASAAVPAGGFLVVDAPFDPVPLRRVLAGKGFTSVGRSPGPSHWRICFRRVESGDALPPAAPPRPKPGEIWREGNVVHIDVRGMAPPGPLTAVLRLVESGDAPAVMAHLDRDPLPLYSELEQRGWECVAKQNHGDEIRLILRPRAV